MAIRWRKALSKILQRLRKFINSLIVENEKYRECARCRDCGRIVHDYSMPNEIWNDVITGSPIIYLKDGITPSKEGAAGVWCYDCFCERASAKGYIAVFRCELIHRRRKSSSS